MKLFYVLLDRPQLCSPFGSSGMSPAGNTSALRSEDRRAAARVSAVKDAQRLSHFAVKLSWRAGAEKADLYNWHTWAKIATEHLSVDMWCDYPATRHH